MVATNTTFVKLHHIDNSYANQRSSHDCLWNIFMVNTSCIILPAYCSTCRNCFNFSHFPEQFTTVMQGSICSVHVCLHWVLYTLRTLSLYLHYIVCMCGQQKGTIFHSKHHETFSCQTGRTTCSSCLPYQRESIIRRAYRIMIPASSKPTSFVRAEKNFFCYIISSLSIPNSFQVEHTIAASST